MTGHCEVLKGLIVSPLRKISTPGGDVMHGLKASSPGFDGFGEAYFSCIETGAVKGWKRHSRMTLNLIVPQGEIRFVIVDEVSGTQRGFNLTPDRASDYVRLTIPPGLWVAFGGVGTGENKLLNIASIEHDPKEAETRHLQEFSWTW